jgi:hypothetical protein
VQRKTNPTRYRSNRNEAGIEETAILAIGRPEFEAAYKQQLEFDKGLDECARRERQRT